MTTSPGESRAYRLYRRAGLAAGVAAFVLLLAIPWDAPATARAAAAMTALMILWWMTEAIPIHLTALVPLLAVPILGCLQARPLGKETWIVQSVLGTLDPAPGGFWYQAIRAADPFLDANNFLFLGGMCIAAAMQKWNLHRRIALHVIRVIGGGPNRIILGFLVATAFLSLWISNTATAVMMVPIGIAVIRQMEKGDRLAHFGLAVMLAIAYAANVGGIGTKIGTAPNVIFCDAAAKAGREIGFLDYLPIGLPFVVLFLPVIWLVLCRIAARDRLEGTAGAEAVRAELAKLGRMGRQEKFVLVCFALAAALWIGGQPLSKLAGLKSTHMDAFSAMVVALLLVAFRALDWPALRRVPWSVLLLLGGSFAMAEAVGESGLNDILARALAALRDWTPILAFLAVSFVTVFISAVASNTATTTLMMNMLRSVFAGEAVVPVMGASAIAASCDFMLPAGTPPNAIVFGSGYVTVPRMMRTGFVLDVLAALLAGLWGYAGIASILGQS